MSTLFYISRKYWAKHKKSAFALMFSGVLLAAVVVAGFLLDRAELNRRLHSYYDETGMYEVILPEALGDYSPDASELPEQFLNGDGEPVFKLPENVDKIVGDVCEGRPNAVTSYAYALGKTGLGVHQYTYGYLDDEAGLMHIPMESGRMPTAKNEIAIHRSLLTQWNWVGKTGDDISLDIGDFKVVGIIDESYDDDRPQCEATFESFYGYKMPISLPAIFIDKSAAKSDAIYRFVMLGNVFTCEEEAEQLTEIIYTEYGEYLLLCCTSVYYGYMGDYLMRHERDTDLQWMMVVARIATFIAVLSVFMVLRGIFASRRVNNSLLHRIGMSTKKICLMYAIECLVFTVMQTVIGILTGALIYLAIYGYQVSVLNMSPHSGFTTDPIVTYVTDNPYSAAIVISIAVMLAAYIINALTLLFKQKTRMQKRKAGSLFFNMGCVLRQRTITVVQTISLTLICFGVMLGYIYCTTNGKSCDEYTQHTDFSYVMNMLFCGSNDYFDMKEDGVEEYYSVDAPQATAIDSYGTGTGVLVLSDAAYKLGVDDETINKLGDVTATGLLKQTMIIEDGEDKTYQGMVVFSDQQEKDLIIELSADEYKKFFESGQLGTKNLFRMETKLTNAETLEALAPYVQAGEINVDKLSDGSEIIAVFKRPMDDFAVGDELEIASIMSHNGYGIGGIATNTVKIGAIAILPDDADKLLTYAVKNEAGYNLLTTVTGANALGLHNAAYNEIICQSEINGGLIPTSAGMTLISYSQLKYEEFLKKAEEYGGVFLVIVIMSLLGFAAYFNGIGMKIRDKAYQISVLRAVGTPLSRIRRRMIADSLKIPLIATAVAGLLTKFVQRIMLYGYDKILALEAPDASGMSDTSEEQQEEILNLISQYFINNKSWVVSLEVPLLIIFTVMCAVTVILTFIALRKFKGNIADTLNSGRERQ